MNYAVSFLLAGGEIRLLLVKRDAVALSWTNIMPVLWEKVGNTYFA